MKTKQTGVKQNAGIIRIVIITIFILLVPLVAMQFSDEVVWGAADFIVAGILLLSMGLVFELLLRKHNTRLRAIGAVLAVALVLIWVELAVGIFD